MASNKIKALPVNVVDVYDKICEAIAVMLSETDISGVGDEGNSEFEVEDVRVKFVDGQFLADIDLQRVSGRMVGNAELEDEVLHILNDRTVTVTCEVEV